MRLSSTSTQRTYRHLRLAIVGAAVMMLVALLVATAATGPVTSLSALYYTPGRTVFTGALFAIALALVALSGHSVEQVLLDVAAPFAVLIALVPTPVIVGDTRDAGELCPPDVECVPASEALAMQVGVTVLVVTTLAAAVAAVVLAVKRPRAPEAPMIPPGVWVPAVTVAAVAIALLVWLTASPDTLLAFGHFIATGVFFGLMVAVAIVSARTARAPWRGVYVVVAVGMVGALCYLAVVFAARLAGADQHGQPWVLVGEVGLICLFAVFWLAQTAQKWDETDPSLLAPL